MFKDKKILKFLSIISLLLLILSQIFAESGKKYEGPEDPAGDRSAVRVGVMNGNQMLMAFSNNTQIANKYLLDGSKWPRDSESGLQIFDFLAVIVGAQVFLEQDSIPVTDEAEIASRDDLDTLHFVETIWNYHGMLDQNPAGDLVWGLHPVPGYYNELSETPAVSDDPFSWPVAGWPSRGFEKKWPGEWNGRFGRGVKYAQKESYFVANDAQDLEYLQPDSPVKYRPRPGVKIGDINPNVTVQKGKDWGGLGLRIEVRGYQWENPQTRDVIFWEYNISNVSDYDLPRTTFGYFVDMGVGNAFNFGDDADDLGGFVEESDMAYVWDYNDVGAGGWSPGVSGITFLESPGISFDNIDNDDDGLTDEKRNNLATQKIGPYDGITDLNKFLAYYGLKEDQLKEHWDADEDQDWEDGYDANGNGIYDGEEDAGNDVGLDGVGPNDLNYEGPDIDGTECNHKPDLLEGVGAEPNFGLTDVTETDMLGLTSFHFITWPGNNPPAPKYDKELYNIFAADQRLVPFSGRPGDYAPVFGSGSFVLEKGTTERISCAMMGSYENVANLNAGGDPHSLVEKKRIVQLIYESDYRFAKAPETPTLKATGGDGKVILTWDRAAELYSAEPHLGGENDFEGYKLYKSTDRSFADAQQVFDGFGNPSGKVPIFQCDLRNDIYGFTDFGLLQGESFFLGHNNGIQHYYIDEDVQNGRTYYYYLVAYDRGIKGIDANIAPAENVASILVDDDENVTKLSKNVQIVTPHQVPNNYVSSNLEVTYPNGDIKGSGTVDIGVFNNLDLVPGNEYKLSFLVDTTMIYPKFPNISIRCRNVGLKVTNETTGNLVFEESENNFSGDNMLYDNNSRLYYMNPTIQTDPFDGVMITVVDSGAPDPEYDPNASGWVGAGTAPIHVNVKENAYKLFPWRYDIVFGNDIEARTYATKISISRAEGIVGFNKNLLLPDVPLNFYVENKMFANTDTTKLDFIAYDANNNGEFDLLEDDVIVGYSKMVSGEMKWIINLFNFNFRDAGSEAELPETGQVYRVDGKRPFVETDEFLIKVLEGDQEKAKEIEDLDQIKVVPNPYIMTNTMEPSLRNIFLNQRRRIMFTHIPAKCDIKIFNISGYLIDEIKVDNEPSNGIVHWDLLTKDDLEIAPGIYVYYLKSRETGKVKTGKFSVIK